MCTAVCHVCVEDTYLKQIIENDGTPILCSVCQSTANNAFTIEELGKALEPIMREHFSLGGQIKRFYDDDSEGWEQEGDPMSYAVQEVLGQYFDFEDEIVDAVCDADDYSPGDGEEPYWDNTANYVPNRIQIGDYYAHWNYALLELKSSRRFFSPSTLDLFDKLFDDIDTLKTWRGNKLLSVARTLPVGTKFHRARIFTSHSILKDIASDPFQYVGPPPQEQARAGRMSPEGVVVFYGARDIDTALAELRPAIGNEVAAISVKTTRRLRLLDFSRLEKAITDKSLSYFQPNFTDELGKQKFLRHLHQLISQPVIPGRETDYLITQTMGEYLAHVYPKPFDGILFASTQRVNGINIVLFSKPDLIAVSVGESFGIKYIDDSLRLYSTDKIEHSHSQIDFSFLEGELYISHDYDYDYDDD
ncbi:RES family NAD+ phosphorylase [Methylotenera sp. N17]|uniref:RES family NAD+ phosphorylase n=1 Tax=Methylotenera sp. N17 TaxID=1502761 RepID=UPI000645FB0D|nr:RES family NAD+ phosphorylase [Methylotenera sp. N17]